MAQILVRNLEDDLKARLRVRAAEHGRSMEEEVRVILREAVSQPSKPPRGLGSRAAARFARSGLRDDESLSDLSGESVRAVQLD